MTDTVATRSYEAILAELRRAIGDERFEIWFSKLKLVSLYRGVLTLGVPNLVYRDWIAENYAPELAAASERTIGARLRVEIVVDAVLQHELREQIATETLQELLAANGLAETEGRAFEEFVRLPENEMAYRTVCHTVRNESFAFNPLVIVGPAGTGKTHLLRAFRGYEGGLDPAKPRVVYVTADRFTRAYTMALKKKEMPAFRARFDDVDVAIFDEVHRFGGRKATQHEFLSVLKDLLRRNVQVVVASRHAPREIYEVTNTFQSNLSAGMRVVIDPYSSSSLQKIVTESLGRARGPGGERSALPRVPREVLRLLSRQVGGNVSLLLSRLDRLYSLARAKSRGVDRAFAEEHLLEIAGATGIEKEVECLVDSICGHFGVDHAELMSKRKLKRLLLPRAVIAVVIRDRMRLSFKRIGQLLGGRSHAAVHSMIDRYRGEIEADHEIGEFLARLPVTGPGGDQAEA